MNDILELGNFRKNNVDIKRNNLDFIKIVCDVIKSGINYNIKSLGKENQDYSDILRSIKDIFNKSDYKNMMSNAVNASIKQGLENMNEKNSSLKDINKMKEISLNGGLKFLASAGIDILLNNLLKGNILSPVIKNVISGIKNFLSSSSFIQKIQSGIDKLQNKIEKFKNVCSEWYNAYEKFDLNKINDIAGILNKQKNNISNVDCLRENDIIQNMTKLINNKKDKLSNMQLQICNNL